MLVDDDCAFANEPLLLQQKRKKIMKATTDKVVHRRQDRIGLDKISLDQFWIRSDSFRKTTVNLTTFSNWQIKIDTVLCPKPVWIV
jgi:hypothetical protein